MKRNTDKRKGFYTVEAAIFLPLVILTVLSLGYFMKVEAAWEGCVHCATDESTYYASRCYDEILPHSNEKAQIINRVNGSYPSLNYIRISGYNRNYSDLRRDHITSYNLEAGMYLSLPIGFSRQFRYGTAIKYRAFTGLKNDGSGMGSAGLESNGIENPVWIFPEYGEKYHKENCTFVRATVTARILNADVRKKYSSCELCDSEQCETGSIVYCFFGEDTAYHRGTCPSIIRRPVEVDITDAEERGFEPCSKCGG